jgi:hypothetical protein
MPRKSAAVLAIAPLAPPPPSEPPAELTPRQSDIWRGIVGCREPRYFDGACRALLVQYCRHVATADVIAGLVAQTDPSNLHRFNRLRVMAARETAAMARLSAKLRLAPQHVRRIEHVAKTPPGRRPWEFVK